MSPAAQSIFEKIRSLRTLKEATGFISNREQRALLASLNADELVSVAEALDRAAARDILSGGR